MPRSLSTPRQGAKKEEAEASPYVLLAALSLPFCVVPHTPLLALISATRRAVFLLSVCGLELPSADRTYHSTHPCQPLLFTVLSSQSRLAFSSFLCRHGTCHLHSASFASRTRSELVCVDEIATASQSVKHASIDAAITELVAYTSHLPHLSYQHRSWGSS